MAARNCDNKAKVDVVAIQNCDNKAKIDVDAAQNCDNKAITSVIAVHKFVKASDERSLVRANVRIIRGVYDRG